MDVASLIETKANPDIPTLSPGDTVIVSTKIVEGEKERIQLFQGIVIKIRRGADGGNFTVRRIAHGIGVERTFPMPRPALLPARLKRQGGSYQGEASSQKEQSRTCTHRATRR